MSWLSSSRALHEENKKFKRSSKVMSRTKLPDNLKTRRCSLTEIGKSCPPAQHTIFKGKQKFSLCSNHFTQYNRKDEKIT